jgi:diguanylate cyclase (GGDEF)-like protein
VVINARDITDSRQLQERLSFQALHDTLTGLPNRRLCADRLHAALAPHQGRLVGLLFVDLDGFKSVNDTLGHDAGDELLRRVAGRISACVRGHDTVARVGGDEFVVLLDGVTGREEVDLIAGRVVEEVRRPVDLPAGAVHVGASVGVALGNPGARVDDVLRSADEAMYVAKRERRGHVWADDAVVTG